MPVIPRKTQKILGSDLVPAGNVAVFGSLAAGAPAYSSDPATIQSLAAWLSGLNGAVVGNRSPTIEDLNGLFLVITQQLAYLLQSGIPEWDTDTTYFTDNYCRVAGVVYVSLIDDNLGNDPVTDTNSWQPYRDRIAPSKSIAKAWVNFNGITGAIVEAFNVDSVVRTGDGTYTINFETPMATNGYAVVGTCGPSDGGDRSNPAGNNNHVCRDVVSTVNEVGIWIPRPDLLVGEDAGVVSVLIFGA